MLLLLTLFIIQQTPEELLRQETVAYLKARQTRNSALLKRYYHPADVRGMHESLRVMYVGIRKDMKKGVFTYAYVKQSVEDSDFADPYKAVLLDYVAGQIPDAAFSSRLDAAFSRYLTSYSYKITDFKVDKVRVEANTAEARALEYRQAEGQKTPQPVSVTVTWKRLNGRWYLTMNRPAHF